MNISVPTSTSSSTNISSKVGNTSPSQLSIHHSQLSAEINTIRAEAQRLGAKAGAQRLALVCDQYDKLSPDVAYHWIDPSGIAQEVEEAQTHKVEFVHIIRNCVSLLPLILTWFALFTAANGYHDYLMNLPKNTTATTSFLDAWQGGFGGTTHFTFAVAAISDVLLLSTYLFFIVLTYWLERRAYRASSSFAQKLQVVTEKLMKVIVSDGLTPLASDADIDKVSHAVQRVVDKAVEMSKQIAQDTGETSQRAIQATQQSAQEAFQASQQSIQETIQTAQQAIQQIVHTAQQTIETSQQSTQQILQASQQAIADSNSKVEEMFNRRVLPMLDTFHQDMGALHTDLGTHQQRLSDLTTASQQLAGASTSLVVNADRYVTIGHDINTQIAALNTTQQDVLGKIGSIANNIGTAATDMSTATAEMKSAAQSIETAATQMTKGMQDTITTVTNQVGRATQSLGQVGNELQTTSYYLQKAAQLLSSLQFGSGGGFVGWIVRRRQNQRKGAGAVNP